MAAKEVSDSLGATLRWNAEQRPEARLLKVFIRSGRFGDSMVGHHDEGNAIHEAPGFVQTLGVKLECSAIKFVR